MVIDVDLVAVRGSALTGRLRGPASTTAWTSCPSASRRPTCRPATRCSSRWPSRWAEVLGADDLFIGVNAVDYSGYPDCRPEFVAAFEALANLAVAAATEGGHRIRVHAPLIELTKARDHRTRRRARGGLLRSPSAATTRTRAGRPVAAATPACCAPQGFVAAGRCDPTRYAVGGPLMAYRVKEIFHTLQGEGVHAGRAAVFCRFAGCNLWSGREEHRGAAVCRFCDTDFVGTDGPGGGRLRRCATRWRPRAVASGRTRRGRPPASSGALRGVHRR